MEIAFAAFTKTSDLTHALTERLDCVEEFLMQCQTGNPASASVEKKLDRLVMTGTSGMRRTLRRSASDPQHAAEMGAVVALTGRLVDLTANLPRFIHNIGEIDCERLGRVATRIKEIREDLVRGAVPRHPETPQTADGPSNLPLLGEIEQTVALIPQAFTASRPLDVFATSPAADQRSISSFVRGALLDPEHIKFALRGVSCGNRLLRDLQRAFLAGDLDCGNHLFFDCSPHHHWSVPPETDPAIRRRDHRRLRHRNRRADIHPAPHRFDRWFHGLVHNRDHGLGVDRDFQPASCLSRSAACVSTFPAWINVLEFKFPNFARRMARDRVSSACCSGLVMMWLFFDQFLSTPTGVEMKRDIHRNLETAGAACPRTGFKLIFTPKSSAASRSATRLTSHFDRVRSLADGVLSFEFGPSRSSDLESRDRIRRWLPQLRALFVMRIASLKYRLPAPGFELPDPIRVRQEEYDDVSARMVEELSKLLERKLHETETEALRGLPTTQAQSFVTLLHGIDVLTGSLATEVATEFPT